MARLERNLLSTLVMFLNETDELLRWRAIEALGLLAGERAREDLQAVRDLVRRQLWSMNDESGGVAWHAAEAVAEILAHVPPLAPEFATILASFASIEPYRGGVHRAIDRLASVDRKLMADQLPVLLGSLAEGEAALRGYAARALGRLGAPEAVQPLKALARDGAPLTDYDRQSGGLVQTTVGQLAREALAELGG